MGLNTAFDHGQDIYSSVPRDDIEDKVPSLIAGQHSGIKGDLINLSQQQESSTFASGMDRDKVIKMPKPTHVKKEQESYFRCLQRFEGLVIDTAEEEFVAILTDKTEPSRPDEEITFSIDEISPQDLPLLKNGAIFYLYIGYEDHSDGQRERKAKITFKRMPRWKKSDLIKIDKEAERIEGLFK